MIEGLEELLMGKEEVVYEGNIANYSERLKKALHLYRDREQMKIGDVVRWKLSLRNRAVPYGQPMIVVDFSQDHVNPIDDPFTPYFKEPLDVAVGTWASNGDFIVYWVDGARLEKHDGSIKKEERELERPVVEKNGSLSAEEVSELLSKFHDEDTKVVADE